MRPLLVVVPVLLGFMLLGTGCARFKFWRKADSPTLSSGPCIGAPAPDLAAIDFDGNPVKLSDYRGKVVMLDFWGDW